MKHLGKWLSLLMILAMVMGCMFALVSCSCGGDPVNPDEPDDGEDGEGDKPKGMVSGLTSNGISWVISRKGELTLSVPGDDNLKMNDYSPSKKAEWAPYAQYIRHLKVGDGVSDIGAYAFTDLKWLEIVEIGNDVKSIGESAFEGCGALMAISVGKKVSKVEDNAFRYCYRLAEVANNSDLDLKLGSLDNGMIARYAVTAHDGKFAYDEDENGFIYVEGDDRVIYLIGYIGDGDDGEGLTLPSKFDGDGYVINSYAFSGNHNIVKLTIEGVDGIKPYAFAGATALCDVTVSAKTLYSHAFSGNHSILKVKISNITTVEKSAFADCSALVSAVLNKTPVGDGMFRDCTALQSVEISSGEVIGEGAFYGCTKLTDVKLPDNLKTIGDYGFYRSGIVTAVLPDTVDTIGTLAFSDCHGLRSVTLGTGMKNIGANAFHDCMSLLEVINRSQLQVQKGETSFGHVAYYAEDVGSGASKFITKNNFVFYAGTTKYLVDYIGTSTTVKLPADCEGSSYYIYHNAFYGDTITSLEFPQTGVTGIGYRAFAYTDIAGVVNIPGSVQRIGTEAFMGSTVQHVVFGKGVKVIAPRAFMNCYSLMYAEQTKNNDSIEQIDYQAFSNSGLVSFRIPSTIHKGRIGERAFYGCQRLVEVIDNNNSLGAILGSKDVGYVACYARVFSKANTETQIVNQDGYLILKKYGMIVGYIGTETDLILPKKVTGVTTLVVAPYAFYGRRDITSVAVTGPTTIGEYAFGGCETLRAVYIDSKVTTIDANAFVNANPLLTIMCKAKKDARLWKEGWNAAKLSYLVIPDEDEATPDSNLSESLGQQVEKVYHVNYDMDYDDYLLALGIDG